MNIVEKLEKRARELDFKLKRMVSWDPCNYDMVAADDRDLLEQAAKNLRALQGSAQPSVK